MNNGIKISLLLALSIVSFALWRNYGVLAKNDIILDSLYGGSKDKSNEQKELIKKVKDTKPNEGDEVKTSFGYYKLSNGSWIKTKEIWE